MFASAAAITASVRWCWSRCGSFSSSVSCSDCHECCNMTPAARLAAAIEVFGNIESERRPAADALKSWGLAHRFAGSGDRAAIAGLVYDALRRRASSAFIMGADSSRAILLGMLKRERGLDADAIAKLADGSGYGPEALNDAERK